MLSFKKNRKLVIAFLLPAFVFYIVFMLSPVFMNAFLSFFKWKGVGGSEFKFVGLRNYTKVLTDSSFWISFGRLLYFVVISVVSQLVLGFILAYLVSLGMKGSRFFKLVYFLPAVLSVTAISLMWKMILDNNKGMLNGLLKAIGLESMTRSWLTDPGLSFTSITLINTWLQVGISFVILLAGIISIPSDLYEAAAIDGANGRDRIFRITIPMMKEIIAVCLILILSNSMKAFDIFYVITNGSFGPGGVNMIPMGYMYTVSFRGNDFGRGSVMALIVMIVGVAMSSMIYFKGFHKAEKGG